MTDTTAVAVVLTTITGGRMHPTGTLTEIPGMDVVSQKVSGLHPGSSNGVQVICNSAAALELNYVSLC